MVRVYIHIYICVCVCVCIYIYTRTYTAYEPRLAISRLHSFVADFMLCWNDVSGKDSCRVWDLGIWVLGLWVWNFGLAF